MKTLKPNALPWLLLSVLVIALDQLTKWIVLRTLTPYSPHAVVPHLLNWTLAFNSGAAFSLLAGASGWQSWLFGVLAIAVSVGLIVWLTRTPRDDWRTALPFALIVGGALGNLIDRLWHGRVTDFIDAYYGSAHFPAFNLADSSISIGAVALIAFGLFGGNPQRDAR